MHDLGLVIYYDEDEGLKDVVVLNPEWLTKAISYVLDDRVTADAEGSSTMPGLRTSGKTVTAVTPPGITRISYG